MPAGCVRECVDAALSGVAVPLETHGWQPSILRPRGPGAADFSISCRGPRRGGAWTSFTGAVDPAISCRGPRRGARSAFNDNGGGNNNNNNYNGGNNGGYNGGNNNNGNNNGGGGRGGRDDEEKREDSSATTHYTTSAGEKITVSNRSKSECFASCEDHFARKRNGPIAVDEGQGEGGGEGGGKEGGSGGASGLLGNFFGAASGAAKSAIGKARDDDQIQECKNFCEEHFALACFPGDASVVVRHRGRIPLASLNVGDLVLVAGAPGGKPWELRFEPVLAWLHRVEDRWADMVEIRHASGQLCMTADHMIFIQPRGKQQGGSPVAVPAEQVVAGDRVLAQWLDGDVVPSEVLSVSKVRKKGLYAPLVESGAFVVSGAVASCYAIPGTVARARLFRSLSACFDGASAHDLAHAACAPLRALCRATKDLAPGEPAGGAAGPRDKVERAPCGPGAGVHSYAWAMYVAVLALSP